MTSEKLSIRQAKREDLPSLWPLCSKYLIDCKGSSYDEFIELWGHRWWGSPFRADNDALGWVLTAQDNRILGFLACIPQMIRMGDKLIKSYAPSTWVVYPEGRSKSLDLFRAFMRLNGSAFLFDTTANPIASRVCERLGMRPVPVKGYQRKYLWILNAIGFLKNKKQSIKNKYLKIIMIPPMLYIISFILNLYLFVRKSRISVSNPELSFMPITIFDQKYDHFWDEIKTGLGIVHEKNSAYMSWRHSNLPRLKGKAYPFICKDREGKIIGCIAMKSNGPQEGGHERFQVTEILYQKGRNDVLGFMLSRAYEYARIQKAVYFEVFGFNQDIMDRILAFNPLVTSIPNLTYWIKYPDNVNYSENIWVSAIDGDLNI